MFLLRPFFFFLPFLRIHPAITITWLLDFKHHSPVSYVKSLYSKTIAYCSSWSCCDLSHNVRGPTQTGFESIGESWGSCRAQPPSYSLLYVSSSTLCLLHLLSGCSLHPKALHRNRRLWLQVGPLDWILIAQQGGKLTRCGFTHIYARMNTHTYRHWE